MLLNLLVLCAALIGADAQAQTPAPVPEAMPFDIPYGTSITLERAKQVAAAAEAEANKHKWKVAISIVDTNGDLVYFAKIDSTQIASIKISQGKAYTAVRYRRPTLSFFQEMETGHPYVPTLDPTLVASPGGNLLVEGGKIIGAVGVSGATGAQDDVVSRAAAGTVK
jgi:uncharacterized protein GlcG (DUF336 family)